MKRALIPVLTGLLPVVAMAQTGTITTQNAAAPPTITSPASIGAPHICAQDYPAEAIAARAEGKTILGFTISETGATKDVHVVTSSGNQALDDAAVACAGRWLYRPASQNGKPVAVPWKAQVIWSLNFPEGFFVAPVALSSHACWPPSGTKIPPGAVSTVGFIVTVAGDVSNVRLVVTSGNRELDRAAVECARDWKYAPARKDGQPVDMSWRENIAWGAPQR